MRHHGRRMALAVAGANDDALAGEDAWRVPIVQTVATEGRGVAELATAVIAHGDYLRQSDEWERREVERSRQEVTQLLQAEFMARLGDRVPRQVREQLIKAVAAREIDPYTAVARLFERLAPLPIGSGAISKEDG